MPASIIIAGVMVSGALMYNTQSRSPQQANLANFVLPANAVVEPIASSDYVLGDPNAPVKIIGFSDLECPFCKQFHGTMLQVMQAYPGKVVWVFRHFPLTRHPKAFPEAEAAECVGKLGGNEVFWKFVTKVFEVTPSNNGLDLGVLPDLAEAAGVGRADFAKCFDGGEFKAKVAAAPEAAIRAGAEGTPYSVVITKTNRKLIIPVALPFSDPRGGPDVKTIVEEALRK